MKAKTILRVFVVLFVVFFIGSLGMAADTKASTKPAPAAKPAEAKSELIDINTANLEQLMQLPGIGDVLAKKIIDGRPYAKKDQLKSKKIIPDATYEKIKDKIIAKQPPKKK